MTLFENLTSLSLKHSICHQSDSPLQEVIRWKYVVCYLSLNVPVLGMATVIFLSIQINSTHQKYVCKPYSFLSGKAGQMYIQLS